MKIPKELARKLVRKLSEKMALGEISRKELEKEEQKPTVFEGPVYMRDIRPYPPKQRKDGTVYYDQPAVIQQGQREGEKEIPLIHPLDVLTEGGEREPGLASRMTRKLKENPFEQQPGTVNVNVVTPNAIIPGAVVTPQQGFASGELSKATEMLAKSLKESISIRTEQAGQLSKMPLLTHTLPERFLHEIETAWRPPTLTQVDERYPLIPPFAYAHIKWEPKEEALRYYVIEPKLTDEQKGKLDYIKNLLADYLNVNLYEIQDLGRAQDYLNEKIEELISRYSLEVNLEDKALLEYFIRRDLLGLDRIEPLMRDDSIEDVSCIGIGIPIYLFHRKYGSIKTNVSYESEEVLNSFLVKLAQKCGRSISVAHPLLDGSLPDGSRVQSTYSSGSDISTKGSTFTIRKFTKNPLTITDVLSTGTIPATVAAYLWLAIEHGNSLLIAGGTASGKTTTLNVLSLFIPPEAKIVSIEDTAELRLPHENWIPKIARTGSGTVDASGKMMGEVTLFDLLKASFRERPDYLIVGEVRGEEAYVLFQLMASGHPGLATIHAENPESLVHRLTTKPLNLSAGLMQSLDIVVFMESTKIKGLEMRRVKEIVEVAGVDLKTDRPVFNRIFKWDAATDSFKFTSDKSVVMNKVIETKGVSEESIWKELERRTQVLEWLRKTNTKYYEDVAKVIGAYYKDPEALLARLKV